MASSGPSNSSGAHIIARSLRDLGITTIFGIVGIPVIEIAEEAINLGIRFIGFRNEQAAGYAATAYGYLTGKPGCCLVVGGPGVLHAMAGIGNANANAFPLLLLAGSSESHLTTKGAFQELDAISLLTPHTKISIRPSLDSIPHNISNAYRSSWYGRPGTGFVDLPADVIQGTVDEAEATEQVLPLSAPPSSSADEVKLLKIAALIKSAQAPLVVIGKGAAYGRAEGALRRLIDATRLPFLPSPMGKGVVPDSHPCNTASARSTALQHADVVLVLGARLNWIFHFGQSPKWKPSAKFIQVDIEPTEIGRNGGDAELGLVGDVSIVAQQLLHHLGGWSYPQATAFTNALAVSRRKNEQKAEKAANLQTQPLKFAHAFDIIRSTLDILSPASDGGVVYVSEGANTMDNSRSSFPVEHPRLRLDAGTYATMGVGMGYAIAAHEAYNGPYKEGYSGGFGARKKIVCLEGDSAFGFSAMEIETMARYQMDCLIFVMNNGGVYHGDSDTASEWLQRQKLSLTSSGEGSLRSTSLGWETRYELLAEAVGGKGYLVRTSEELAKATKEGFEAKVPVIVNVMIESGKGSKLGFGWQASAKKPEKKSSKL